MSENVPLFGIAEIIERGIGDGGDVGVLGIVTPEGERAGIFMRHTVAEVMALEMNALLADIHRARNDAGKEARAVITKTRRIVAFGAMLEHRGQLMLDVIFEGGIKTTLGLDGETVDSLISTLQQGREAMKAAPPA